VLVAGVRVETVETWGVKQSKITVRYRFSQPNQMPVVLPQSHSPATVVRVPAQLNTIGDHIRRKRLSPKMLQKELAKQVGVDEASVYNWEANASAPRTDYLPAIIRFLGYNPLPAAKSLGERLVRQRTTLGLTQKECAQSLGVDPGTLARWERNEREPTGAFMSRVEQFLEPEPAHVPAARRAG